MPGPFLAIRVITSIAGRGLLGSIVRFGPLLGGDNKETERKMRVATAIALTRTAKEAQQALEKEIAAKFDAPVPYTRRAIGITPANKNNLTATVFVKRGQLRYLEPQIYGGTRRPKRFEQRLGDEINRRIAGSVPGGGAKINNAGNISRAELVRMLKEATTKGTDTFIARPGGHLAPGIYRKVGRRVVPLLLVGDGAPRYGKRLDFFGVGKRVVDRELPEQMRRAMRQILG